MTAAADVRLGVMGVFVVYAHFSPEPAPPPLRSAAAILSNLRPSELLAVIVVTARH